MEKQNLISCKPAIWDVTEQYLRKEDNSKLKVMRRLPTVGKQVQKKIVSVNGEEAKEYTLGKNGDYWRNGISLLSVLQTVANTRNNRVSIS